MRSSTLVAMLLAFLSTLYERTVGWSLPTTLFHTSHQQTAMRDLQDVSCPTDPPMSTTERTVFGREGCVVYGYPSTGGVLRKEADLLDMLFLSLPRTHELPRSPDVDEEDRFCKLLRRTGATWWPSKEAHFEALVGITEMTEEQEKVVVFGWPTDTVGVWVLRFASAKHLPRDFGRMQLAMTMEERIQIMREYGATFVEDLTQVEELQDPV